MYEVQVARTAQKEISDLPPNVSRRVIDRLSQLKHNPRPSGVRKLQGSKDLWRIRIGDYRVVYRIKDSQLLVLVVRVKHRRDAYD